MSLKELLDVALEHPWWLALGFGLIAFAGWLGKPLYEHWIVRLFGRPDPVRVPESSGGFFGRDDDLRAILKVLRNGGSAAICALEGMGGIGKTRLANEAAHRLKRFFVRVDLRGASEAPMSVDEAMWAVLTFSHAPFQLPRQKPEGESLKALYLDQLARHKPLLILDNASGSEQAAALRPPARVQCIITSRYSICLPGLAKYDIDAIPLKAAVEMLRAYFPKGDKKLLKQVAEACFRVPYALEVAGRTIGDGAEDPQAYLARLRADRPGKLEAVMRVLRSSYDRAMAEKPDVARLWPLLSVFPAAFDAEGATAVCAVEDGADLLIAFHRFGLIERQEDDRYRLHDLMRDVARQVAAPEILAEARLCHAEWVVEVLGRANALYLGGKVLDGLALFDRHRADVEAAFDTVREGSDRRSAELCMRLLNAGVYVFSLRLSAREHIVWLEASLAAARSLGNRRGEGYALGNLGNAWAALGEARKAVEYYEQHRVIAREIGDRRGEGATLGNLGNAWAALGETRKAVKYYEQRLVIAREIGDRRGEGNALGNLGVAWRNLGEARKAVEYQEQALLIFREISDRLAEGLHLGNLGLAWAALGEARKAVGCYEQQLVITREIGDRRGEGTALGNFGLAWAALGETRKALEYFEQWLVIAREIGDRWGEGAALGNLGNVWKNLGAARKAVEYYEQSLVITREIGNRRGEGNSLGNMAETLWTLGEREAALGMMAAAAAIYESIELPDAAQARARLAAWRAGKDG